MQTVSMHSTALTFGLLLGDEAVVKLVVVRVVRERALCCGCVLCPPRGLRLADDPLRSGRCGSGGGGGNGRWRGKRSRALALRLSRARRLLAHHRRVRLDRWSLVLFLILPLLVLLLHLARVLLLLVLCSMGLHGGGLRIGKESCEGLRRGRLLLSRSKGVCGPCGNTGLRCGPRPCLRNAAREGHGPEWVPLREERCDLWEEGGGMDLSGNDDNGCGLTATMLRLSPPAPGWKSLYPCR
jgi:hypothetical protein